jgi:hypothetical protein
MWCGDKVFRTQGHLTKQEQASKFINEFEFMGFTNCLWALLPQAIPDRSLWSQVHIAVELDNTTAIKHGTCAVSRSIRMSEKGAEHFDERERHQLSVSLTHLAGLLNVEADAPSRQQSTHIDWQVNVHLIQQAWKFLHTKPVVDLFTSAANCQTQRFYSHHHDHRSLGTGCFQHPWDKLGTLYARPPPILIGTTLRRLATRGATV